MTYIEVWNRMIYLCMHDPENPEIQELLDELARLDKDES